MVSSNSFLNYLLRTAVLLYHRYGIERSTKTLQKSYDFIVVGGGSAGAIVASKLSNNPSVSVLLIESGGSGSHITDIPFLSYSLSDRTNMSRKLYSTLQDSRVCNGNPCPLKTGRGLGGGSTQDSMIYVRGSRQDYSEWTRLGIKGWSYEEVLPYMVELETYEDVPAGQARGLKGPVHVTRQNIYPFNSIRKRWKSAALAAGYKLGDYNGPRQTYFADMQKNIRNGVRQSTDNVYLKPIMGKRSNLDVIMFSHVTRVLFDGNTAVGVEYSRNGTLNKVLASREVILSAGTLASPQILMLSGIGPKRQLEDLNIKVRVDLPGVGQNLQDHLGVSVLISTNSRYPKNGNVTRRNYDLWKRHKKGILAASYVCSTSFTTSKYSVNSNDSQSSGSIAIFPDNRNSSRILMQVYFLSARTLSRGYVRLQSTSSFDSLIVNPRYLARSEDSDNLMAAFKLVLGLMKTRPFAAINAKLIVDSVTRVCSETNRVYSDAWLYCIVLKNSYTDYHYTGTCKMGALSDPMAVVDDRLRVRNVRHLRVIDASIMPQVTRGGTSVPSMVIGLKGAAMIRRDYQL